MSQKAVGLAAVVIGLSLKLLRHVGMFFIDFVQLRSKKSNEMVWQVFMLKLHFCSPSVKMFDKQSTVCTEY